MVSCLISFKRTDVKGSSSPSETDCRDNDGKGYSLLRWFPLSAQATARSQVKEKRSLEFELRFCRCSGKLTLDLGQGSFMKAINLRPYVFTPEYALMENVFILSFEASRSR